MHSFKSNKYKISHICLDHSCNFIEYHENAHNLRKTPAFYEKATLFLVRTKKMPPYKKLKTLISAFTQKIDFWKELRPLQRSVRRS